MKYSGGCHCGAIRFEVEAEQRPLVIDCNCSICSKTGYLHLIVPRSQFKLMRGEESITTYAFNTGVAKHTFCRICGCKPFYTPRSNPDGIDVNVRCLDVPPLTMERHSFDGQNWEQHSDDLVHLSRDDAVQAELSGHLVIVCYRPRTGRAADLRTLVREHVPTLQRLGLATARAPVVMQAQDGTLLEVFEWISRDALDAAHGDPEVAALWERFAVLCDYVALTDLAESATPFAGFVPCD